MGVGSMAPTTLMSIATTFGTASTGTAISTLSGCVAQKAALAWIGRMFAGFAAEDAGIWLSDRHFWHWLRNYSYFNRYFVNFSF